MLLARCYSSVLIKIKSEAKTFVLRNIQPHLMTTCDRLSALIRDQLGGDVREKFDVGYFQKQ